jgi:cobalamin biosynthesis protein CobW
MILDQRPSHHDHEADHEHDDDISSISLVLEAPPDPKTLVRRLESLVKDHEIYRVKGFVNVPQKPLRLVLQGVGHRFETFYDRPWQPTEIRQTRLVIIGKSLDASMLSAALRPLAALA